MDTIKFAIRSRYDDSVLYEADIPADTPSGLRPRVALEKATRARANLAGANLTGADLARAYGNAETRLPAGWVVGPSGLIVRAS